MPDTDPLSATLEEIRKRYEAWGDASDVPRLLTALDAVLKLHQRSILPASRGEHKGQHFCRACSTSVDDFTVYVDWPCPEVQAIRALTGEADDGD